MATHFMRILSRMMVPGLARTLLSVADTQCLCVEDTQARCAGRACGGGSRATPTPLGLTKPPCPHTRLLSCAAGGILPQGPHSRTKAPLAPKGAPGEGPLAPKGGPQGRAHGPLGPIKGRYILWGLRVALWGHMGTHGAPWMGAHGPWGIKDPRE